MNQLITWVHVTFDGSIQLSIEPLNGAAEHLHSSLFYLVPFMRFYDRPSPCASPASFCSVLRADLLSLSQMRADSRSSHASWSRKH